MCLTSPLQRLPREIEPVIGGVTTLQQGYDAQRLGVVIEAAELFHAAFQSALAGVAERRMTEIVRQGDGFGEIVVEPEAASQSAGDLGHLDRMSEARAEMIAVERHKHLGFMSQTPERR